MAELESSLPDLVIDCRIEAVVTGQQTFQAKYISNPATGQRRTRVEECWLRQRELGRGSYGVVWLETCESRPTGGAKHEHDEARAVKEIRKDGPGSSAGLYRELDAVVRFSQERYRDHFVQSRGWFENDDSIFITMEYLPLGDLERMLTAAISEQEARSIVEQVLEGLEFMHDANFVHRDLKPGNILVQSTGPNWWVKLGDFGISKRLIESTALRTVIGTPAYLAPEVLGIHPADTDEEQPNSYSSAVDIWALGAITYRMVTGETAFPAVSRRLVDYVVRGLPLPIDPATRATLSPTCLRFIQEMMAPAPAHRPSATNSLKTAWIQGKGLAGAGAAPGSVATTRGPVTPSPPSTIDTTSSSAIGPLANALHSLKFSKEEGLESSSQATPEDMPSFSKTPSPLFKFSKISQPSRPSTDSTGRFERSPFSNDLKAATSAAFSADGRRFIAGFPASDVNQRRIIVWSYNPADSSFSKMQELKTGAKNVDWVAISPDCRHIASAEAWESDITLFEDDNGGEGKYQDANVVVTDSKLTIRMPVFSQDGSQIAAGGEDGSIVILKTSGRSQFSLFQILRGNGKSPVVSIAFSKDGKYMASGEWDRSVGVWKADVVTGKWSEVSRLWHADFVNCVAFSPAGRELASASDDESVIVWAPATEEEPAEDGGRSLPDGELWKRRQVIVAEDRVHSAAFSPTGKRLVSGRRDGTVAVWHEGNAQTETMSAFQNLQHVGYIKGLVFSGDGRIMASMTMSNGVVIWQAD